ncbi:LPXTG cell wall anchor domain-containing protein [Aerococcus sp. UMB10185]|uniref:LPXTG cell wall anchor domain-containing protein n=1 Tax=unclassified Aerococcus TaxID=2618060 RepID=UPI0008A28D0C|nr:MULTISPECIES: LPXTG cell wall anchor domain-containing protein [unclassified Aerococcus]MDK6233990.1 LPXTG cell wall anchor domain-containing protein [Aerococcus sp. UMB10185]MDK6856540.1 LPXTG cell wall anchor domain-containing protein [Aerococcus sp. UMB7533]OFN03431.1 hypothetical protein HMPREF2626_06030 [Aerococcus sp. HMSC062A02]OHO45753.1 hypothetical protein HMPREF2705_04135 [Aerococcus sp. HMSC035B07]
MSTSSSAAAPTSGTESSSASESASADGSQVASDQASTSSSESQTAQSSLTSRDSLTGKEESYVAQPLAHRRQPATNRVLPKTGANASLLAPSLLFILAGLGMVSSKRKKK